MAGDPPLLYRHLPHPTMKATVSTPRLVLAVAALALAWAPAATLARPGAQHSGFVSEASAQSRAHSAGERSPVDAEHDSLLVPVS